MKSVYKIKLKEGSVKALKIVFNRIQDEYHRADSNDIKLDVLFELFAELLMDNNILFDIDGLDADILNFDTVEDYILNQEKNYIVRRLIKL